MAIQKSHAGFYTRVYKHLTQEVWNRDIRITELQKELRAVKKQLADVYELNELLEYQRKFKPLLDTPPSR